MAVPSGQKSVLIVEDDKALLFALAEVVRGSGYEAVVAESAEDAILMLEDERHPKAPSCVVVDLGLPGMRGGRLIEWMRHHSRLKTLPIIVVTGATDVTSQLNDRPDRILGKPVTPDELRLALDSLVNWR